MNGTRTMSIYSTALSTIRTRAALWMIAYACLITATVTARFVFQSEWWVALDILSWACLTRWGVNSGYMRGWIARDRARR